MTALRERKDVTRNRALLLAAADQLISERGLEVGFHDIAAQAHVGIGTVYRHFPDKQALLGALVEQRIASARELLLTAAAIDDPLESLRQAILRSCAMQLRDRAQLEALMSQASHHRDLVRAQLAPIMDRIVARAVASGRVRPDFSPSDVAFVFLVAGAVTGKTAAARPDLWRRYVETLLDGFVCDDADRTGTAVPSLTEAEFEAILAAHP